MINIRLGEINDAEKLYELCLLFNNSETATTEENIKHYLKDNQEMVWIAEDDGKLIGFITGCIESNLSFGTPIGTISEVFVRSEYRKKGIATQLFKQIEKVFLEKGVYRFRVMTTANNTKAANFYGGLNYQSLEMIMFRKDLVK